MKFKLNDKVKTKYGIGIVKDIENFTDLLQPIVRYGVYIENLSDEKVKIFADKILYFFENEVQNV